MNKHLTLSGLQTVLPPIKHLIDKKAENIDWNESDPNAKGYIRNKPFYEEVKETFVQNLPTVTLTASIQEGFNNPVTGTDLDSPLIEGQTYTVVFDDVTYQCLAKNYDGYIMIGNNAIYEFDNGVEDDTGEPFAVEMWSEVPNEIYFFLLEEKEFTVSISSFEKVTTIKKIDEKFLPEQEIEFGHGNMIGMPGEGRDAEIFNDYDNNKASGRFSHAEGSGTTASSQCSHAEGWYTTASNRYAHAEGFETEASGDTSHAEGSQTKAVGTDSHAEGYRTEALSYASHAEGYATDASGSMSHAEGWATHAAGDYSHAEGVRTLSYGENSHAEGFETISYGDYSHAEGLGHSGNPTKDISITGDANSYTYTLISGNCKVGQVFTYNSIFQHVTAVNNDQITFSGTFSGDVAFNEQKISFCNGVSAGPYSHVEGGQGCAIGEYSHVEGYYSEALGKRSHAEGNYTRAGGYYSHAEGTDTIASGDASHAEGNSTFAYGENSHAEGKGVLRSFYVTAEGGVTEYTLLTTAHSELFPISVNHKILYKNNYYTITAVNGLTVTLTTTLSETALNSAQVYLVDGAVGENSHSEGASNIAAGLSGHVEGTNNFANETNSHAEGNFTVADGKNQHVQGCGNLRDLEGKYSHIVGNGTFNGSTQKLTRSNAHTLDWSGNAWYQGDVFVGGSGQDDAAAKRLATEEFVAAPKSSFTLIDEVTGENYVVCIRNGSLVTYKAE